MDVRSVVEEYFEKSIISNALMWNIFFFKNTNNNDINYKPKFKTVSLSHLATSS